MAGIKFANNVATTITSAINDSTTTIPVNSIAGFPTQTGGDYFYATLAPAVEYADSVREIVKVTAWTTTSLTVVRAQDGTSGASWASGSKFEIRFPRVAITELTGSFATLSGTETLTNKSINLSDNTLTGTTSQFNTALSDDNFVTLTGTETLTNKTLTAPVLGTPTSGTLTNCSGLPRAGIVFDGQIPFPSTQNPSSDSYTLDDYKEIPFTPTLTFASPGNVAVTYGIQRGFYVKVGNTITVNLEITTTSFTHTTASGNLTVGLGGVSLPTNSIADVFTTYITGTTFPAGCTQVVATSSTKSTMSFQCFGSGASGQITHTTAPSGSTITIRINGTYLLTS